VISNTVALCNTFAEKRKKDEEMREQERQHRKLNFLIRQTEIFSHFIGKKMGVIPPTSKTPTNAATAVAGPASTNSTDASTITTSSTSTTSQTKPTDTTAASVAKAAAELSVDPREDDKMRRAAEAATTKYIKKQLGRAEEFDETARRAAAAADTSMVPVPSFAVVDDDSDKKPSATGAAAGGGAEPMTMTTDGKAVAPSSTSSEASSIDLLNPSTMPEQDVIVREPSSFVGKLKSYQLRGLNWLANLYDQGINGILADEMGLGKTIQTLAFLAHLSGTKQIWGPFLIVAPASTVHQWQQEVRKFCPELRVLPYWGTKEERRIIRKYWSPKSLYSRDAPFHVLVTSYSVAVADEQYFKKLSWSYMVIISFTYSCWKIIPCFHVAFCMVLSCRYWTKHKLLRMQQVHVGNLC
jgi:DNA helicase INO80